MVEAVSHVSMDGTGRTKVVPTFLLASLKGMQGHVPVTEPQFIGKLNLVYLFSTVVL